MNEIKGQKLGEHFIKLSDPILESILKKGLLPRAKVREMIGRGEMPELAVTDICSSLTKREYIDEANELIDAYRPGGIAHPRTDSVFAFVYRGHIEVLKEPDEYSRSVILIHGLTGEEVVGDGCHIDNAVWYLVGAREGWPNRNPFARLSGSGLPQREPKISEEEAQKVIKESAEKYWSTLIPLDKFIENYRAKGLTWANMEYDDWVKITDKVELPEIMGYPEIMIPSGVEPSRLEIALKYIHKK
jgi:hypothetical protein